MADQVQLIEVVNILGSLARSAHLKRVLSALDPDPALNFWRVMHGNLLDITVLEWCKLFGSDHEEHQKTHWKNVVTNQEAFRAGLLQDLGVDMKAWETYWLEMKNYRDQHVAHLRRRGPFVHDVHRIRRIPNRTICDSRVKSAEEIPWKQRPSHPATHPTDRPHFPQLRIVNFQSQRAPAMSGDGGFLLRAGVNAIPV